MKKVSYKICVFFEEQEHSVPSVLQHPQLDCEFIDLEKARIYCAQYIEKYVFTYKSLKTETMGIFNAETGKIVERINRKNFRIFLPKNSEDFSRKISENYLLQEMENKFVETWKIGWFI